MKKFMRLCLVAIFTFSLFTANAMAADQAPASGSGLEEKINQILSAQTEILKQLAEIKAELEVVKIRASVRA